eukprot:12701278-Alexandrium_andersonii.AAC.1
MRFTRGPPTKGPSTDVSSVRPGVFAPVNPSMPTYGGGLGIPGPACNAFLGGLWQASGLRGVSRGCPGGHQVQV